jgi:DNA-binding response OmpR family regulator
MTRLRILIIEPNLELSEVLQEYLAKSGFEVSTIQAAQQALQAISQDAPDLVLCEEELPDMDGLAFSKALRGASGLDRLPLILISGDSSPEHRLACLDSGAHDYLLKPFSMKELVRRCRQHIELSRPGSLGELSGDLSHFKTTDILQMLEANQSTGVLQIEAKETKGEIHLLDGYICGGFAGPERGEDAIYRLVPLRQGRFTFVHSDIRSNIQSVRSTTEFMMEALRRHDERERMPASDHTGF